MKLMAPIGAASMAFGQNQWTVATDGSIEVSDARIVAHLLRDGGCFVFEDAAPAKELIIAVEPSRPSDFPVTAPTPAVPTMADVAAALGLPSAAPAPAPAPAADAAPAPAADAAPAPAADAGADLAQ